MGLGRAGVLVQAPQGAGRQLWLGRQQVLQVGPSEQVIAGSRGQGCCHRRKPWGPSLHEDRGRVQVQIQAAEEGRTDLQKVLSPEVRKVGSAMSR